MSRGNDPGDPLLTTDFGVAAADADGRPFVAFRFIVKTGQDPIEEPLHFVLPPHLARHVAEQLVAAATDAEGTPVEPSSSDDDGRSANRPLLITNAEGSWVRMPGVQRPLAGVRVLATEFYAGTDAIARRGATDGHWIHFALVPNTARRWSDVLLRSADDADAKGREMGLPPVQ